MEPTDPLNDDGARLMAWKRFTFVLAGVATLLLGVVGATLPQSFSYGSLLDENLALKQQVQDVEGKLADVDHILLQMRLYDAQMKALVGAGDPEGDLAAPE